MANSQTVERVDLSQLTNPRVLRLVGHYEDGRELKLDFAILTRLGDYAYGLSAASEQLSPGGKEEVWAEGLRSNITRLPNGVIEPGDFTAELAQEKHLGVRREELEVATWQTLPGHIDRLELIDF